MAKLWKHIGGDLEACVTGKYVDIRVVGKPETRLFLSRGTLLSALLLFPEFEKDKPVLNVTKVLTGMGAIELRGK